MMAPTGNRLSDEIRLAVEHCGQTRYAISKATGIAQEVLSRFVNGERGLNMDTLDTLAAYLDLHITTRKPKREGKKR
jgi:hypothetical protein